MTKLRLRSAAEQEAMTAIMRPGAGEPVYLAIDVSRSKWVHCVRWKDQEVRFSTPGALPHLEALLDRYAHCELHVVYEACGFGYEIAWLLQQRRINFLVIAPCKVERAPGRRVKTDRLDAAAMARKYQHGELRGIYIPTREQHARRELARAYVQARKDRRRQQARVRALLQEQGIIGPSPSQGWVVYERWLRTQTLPGPVQSSVNELLELRCCAAASARRLKAAMIGCLKTLPEAASVKALAQQPGIGPFSASWLVLELCDIRRFARGAALVHYLGLGPSEYSSGEVVHRGHILKCGPGVLRALLVECAWRSIHPTKGDRALRTFYERLRAKGLEPKQAIVAVTRKLALCVFARWSAALAAERPAHAA